MKVLTWNLFHGRSLPAAGVELSESFAALLGKWEWDVALLQEVPPWWVGLLARRTRADQRTALTSRNAGLAVRRAIGERWPDLLKSNAGGCNAVLIRGASHGESHSHRAGTTPRAPTVREHRAIRLRLWPERRVGQLLRFTDGVCMVNFHASTSERLAEAELTSLWEHALRFAGDAPLILGGDLNLRAPRAPDESFLHAASRDVDHLFVRGLRPEGAAERLDRWVSLNGRRVRLSDHLPLRVTLSPGA